MKRGLLILVVSALLGGGATLHAASERHEYSPSWRKAYIKEALLSFRRAPKPTLDGLRQFVGFLERSTCKGSFGGLKLSCVVEEARKNCESSQGRFKVYCPILTDIIAVNRLNESRFISRDEQVEAAVKSADYAAVHERMLNGKYALLTTEFLLLSKVECEEQNEEDCLAKALDQYCLQNADVKNLPWQACVGAIVWFVGMAK